MDDPNDSNLMEEASNVDLMVDPDVDEIIYDPNYARFPVPFNELTEEVQRMIMEQRAVKERPERPEPMRVLVRTLTHLVPGADANEKFMSMCHRISKHQWGYEFSPIDTNVIIQGGEFGYNSRPCWFLLDHGEHPTGSHDPSLVPMKVYHWDGENFHEHTQPLSAQVREELKQYIFMPSQEQRNWVGRPENSPTEWRKFIRRKLRKMAKINDADIDFIQENPEHAEWLKIHVRPRFWERFQELTEEREERLAEME
ncbi:hypothetical protein N0V82_008761 [Gnomoniopsis sp. IMI 355080]|nr:hypothetical protein N0V82_008761 [Gnomoniopsis sp. IMI 355080]